jgi:hypothetical protein
MVVVESDPLNYATPESVGKRNSWRRKVWSWIFFVSIAAILGEATIFVVGANLAWPITNIALALFWPFLLIPAALFFILAVIAAFEFHDAKKH